jgi:hypothetical protein
MMLRPADGADTQATLSLLQRGFPHRSPQFWKSALDRVVRFNRRNGHDQYGQLLIVRDEPAGVMLTLTSEAEKPGGERYKLTNLSSWYVEPKHRLLAPIMLQKLVRPGDQVFTDLTPSDRVMPMLPMLGFKPLNAGLTAIALPLAALGRKHESHVRDFKASGSDFAPVTCARIEGDMAFGATASVQETRGKAFPLLFLSRKLRGLPVAQLIYCEDNALFVEDIVTVARYLLKKGYLVLVMDIPLNQKIPGAHFLKRGLKFAKGGCFDNRTDYAGSELLVVGQ